jgi:hypothetical protein
MFTPDFQRAEVDERLDRRRREAARDRLARAAADGSGSAGVGVVLSALAPRRLARVGRWLARRRVAGPARSVATLRRWQRTSTLGTGC